MTTENTTLQSKPEAAIQQINLGYNIQQDRLLLRVGLADNSDDDMTPSFGLRLVVYVRLV